MKKTILGLLVIVSINLPAQTETADPNNIDQIIRWVSDGVTERIIFPEGVYKFSNTLSVTNNNLVFEGEGIGLSVLKLTSKQNTLIDAVGNNMMLTDLTLNGADNQKSWGSPIFRFNKSKGHTFENVGFENSIYNAISAITAYATDGLTVKHCTFSNIDLMPIQIFNRNTIKRGGEVVISVEKVLIDGCTFYAGYKTGVSSDNGNDREDSGDGTGRRYTESTSLNGTIIQNCTFEKSTQFHIAMVQTKDVIIQNNMFEGMTDDAGPGCQSIHCEQFCHNIEIYNNTFNMSNTVSRAYTYIHFQGTEGHKRVTQERASDTYATWTYNVKGSNERRASTSCAREGHINKDCKRDVHAYGARNIYIAGNIFNASDKVHHYLTVNEGENIQIGTKRDGTVALNSFLGGDDTTTKITFGGNDQGTGNVLIKGDQGILESNVDIKDVYFDLPAIRLQKPIVIETKSDVSVNEIHRQDVLFYPNPASNFIYINSSEHEYSVSIFDITGAVRMNSVKKKASDDKVGVSGLKRGIYQLVYQSKKGDVRFEKLMIK